MYKILLEKEYFHFCSAHFVVFSESEREELHGHNYYVTAEFVGTKLIDGKLIDISIIKPIIRQFCDELDHKLIIPKFNKHLTLNILDRNIQITHAESIFSFPLKETLLLPIENSTMEHLAEYLSGKLKPELAKESHFITEFTITIHETRGQMGSYTETI